MNDEAAMVRRVYGPPGTGKTTRLSQGIRGEVEQHGADGVLVGSFSVAAAEVLAGRNTNLPKTQIGTLHKHAYSAVGRGAVALDPKVVGDWNDSERPEWFIHADGRRHGPPVEQENDDDDAPINTVGTDVANARTGDQLITALDLLRSTMTPPQEWPPNVVEFAQRWEAWKRAVGGEAGQAVDYADMVLLALDRARDGEPAPGSPRALVFDEAQDMTPAEVALVLRWGRNGAERVVFGLDDDQAIMSWRGGHPETLIGLGTDPERTPDHDLWVDPEQLVDTVLDQSFRIPSSAHRIAENWVRKLSIRREKTYRSRQVDSERFGPRDDAMGTARVVPESLTDAALVDRIESHTAAGRRVMVLASCNYQLSELISELRRRGVPFHNPYRPAEPRWNPLGKTAGISTPQRLFRYLVMDDRELGERARLWTGEDVAAWVELLDTKTAGLAHGAKAMAKRLGSGTLEPDQVAELFAGGEHSEAFAAAVQPDLAWFERSMLASKAATAPVRYGLSVVRNAGVAALVDEPMVTVGTTHCSPVDEPVLTTDGYVPIGQLDPTRHRLASYDAGVNLPVWNYRPRQRAAGRRPDGYEFRVARNPYRGPLLTLTTKASRTRVTPDHRVRVKWADSFDGKYVVYLMRRGSWWRIGICRSVEHDEQRSVGRSGLYRRMVTERADAAWILRICGNRREALRYEVQAQVEYGIPGLTFEAAGGKSIYSTNELHEVHSALAEYVAPRAKELIDEYGYSESCPLYSTGQGVGSTTMRGAFVTEARNVLSDYMLVPTIGEAFAPGDKPSWRAASVTTEWFDDDVYSLDVLPYHYYVSGGAIVHNSAKGGEADIVMVSPDISRAAACQLGRPGGKDAVIRLFYVAMTRCLFGLEVLSPSSRYYVKLRDLLPAELEVTA